MRVCSTPLVGKCLIQHFTEITAAVGGAVLSEKTAQRMHPLPMLVTQVDAFISVILFALSSSHKCKQVSRLVRC